MENVSDALKMAFAVFIFVFALSLAFSTITQAKEVADIVLFANDKTNYYTLEKTNYATKGRIVGIDTVISTIYRCKNETMHVDIADSSGNISNSFDSATDSGELQTKIETFVKDNISLNNTYEELFVEAKYSGKELTAEDGSSIIITKGGTKMYITYIQQ